MGALVRLYSYLFHAVLSLFLLGLAAVAMESGAHSLKLDMLPWKGVALTRWLLGLALTGLISILLAWAGKLRFLFLLYAIAVFGLLLRGYFLSAYSFRGKDEFRMAAWLTAGALLAIFGAWSQFRRKRRKKS